MPVLEIPSISIRDLQTSIRRDPVLAAEKYFGFDCKTWEQADLIRSDFKYPRTIFSSGTSLGKTYSYKVSPWLWILSRDEGGVIITSTDFTALDEKLWPLVCEGHGCCGFDIGGHLNSELWCCDPKKQWPRIVKMSPLNPLSAQGWHPPGGLKIMVDEASFLCEANKEPLVRALEGSASGAHDIMTYTMNPTHSVGPAVDALDGPEYEENHVIGFHKIIQSSLDSPNVLAGYDKIPGMCSKERVEYVRQKYGEDSYEWCVKILGRPPTEDELTVITPKMIDAAKERYEKADPQGVVGQIRVGIDTSLTAVGDENTCFAGDDARVLFAEGCHYDTCKERYDWATRCLKEITANFGAISIVNIDAMGDPEICGMLKADAWPINPVRFGDDAHDCDIYRNQRAEMAYNGRRWLREKKGMIPPEAAKRLRPECQVQRKPGGDRIQLEDKDAVRKRIKRSCDNFDGFILTFAQRPGIAVFSGRLAPCQIPQETPPVVLRLQNYNSGQYQWRIALRGQARTFVDDDGVTVRIDRPGALHRSMWLSRNSESACLWIHVDEPDLWDKRSPVRNDPGGCHTVIDAAFWPAGVGIAEIARNVAKKSRDEFGYWHDYASDAACGQDTEGFLNAVCEIMAREARREVGLGMLPLPSWYQSEAIAGKRGLDLVGDLAEGTLSRRAGPMLLSYPERVLADLEQVMMSQPKSGGFGIGNEDLQDAASVKALRLMLVAGMPV